MQQSRVGITAFKSWLSSCQQHLSPADNQRQRHCFPVPWNDRWPAWIWASPQLVQSMPKSSPGMDGHIPRVFLHSRSSAAASHGPFSHVGKNQECWSCGSHFLTPCATRSCSSKDGAWGSALLGSGFWRAGKVPGSTALLSESLLPHSSSEKQLV